MKQFYLKILFASIFSTMGLRAFAFIVAIDGIYYDIHEDEMAALVTSNGGAANSYSGSVTIPASVTYNSKEYSVVSIVDRAFYNCRNLTSVTIPNGVTSIGSNAFYNCISLNSITIPNSVTYIGASAFECCTGMKSLILGNGVVTIGESAFSCCSELTSVTIPNSVVTIGNYAFYNCQGLTSVAIPNSVTSIGKWAFNTCKGLTSVIIGSSVTSIGDQAFSYCTGIQHVYCYTKDVPSVGFDGFFNANGGTLHVLTVALDAYKTTSPWNSFGTIVAMTPEEELLSVKSINASSCVGVADGYDLKGHRIPTSKHGLNIIRMSDGTTQKVMVK